MTYALLTEGLSAQEKRRFDHKLRPPIVEGAGQPKNDPGDLEMLKRMMGA